MQTAEAEAQAEAARAEAQAEAGETAALVDGGVRQVGRGDQESRRDWVQERERPRLLVQRAEMQLSQDRERERQEQVQEKSSHAEWTTECTASGARRLDRVSHFYNTWVTHDVGSPGSSWRPRTSSCAGVRRSPPRSSPRGV